MQRISIHAPARGATAQRTHYAQTSYDFNPRTREGCDRQHRDSAVQSLISIHAPARGATCDVDATLSTLAFQSTHPRGVRLSLCPLKARHPAKFQSTHPRGVRRFADRIYRTLEHFNPRTREGCDPLPTFCLPSLRNFNPRTREGCDIGVIPQSCAAKDFNPRTREGCDFVGVKQLGVCFIFQSTHPRGVRL